MKTNGNDGDDDENTVFKGGASGKQRTYVRLTGNEYSPTYPDSHQPRHQTLRDPLNRDPGIVTLNALLLLRASTMELRESPDPATPFLDTVEGEMSFFRSIMRARPIGLHRHFHVLSMRTAIHQDTGRYVSIDDIWEKLRSCYNVDALESLVRSTNNVSRIFILFYFISS